MSQTKQNHYFVDLTRKGWDKLGELAALAADYIFLGCQRNKMTEVLLR